MLSNTQLSELGPTALKEMFQKHASQLPGMTDVNRVIESKFASEVPLLEEIPAYLFSTGGKRLRPLLALVVSSTCGAETPSTEVIDVAAGIELIHMATLLHDDIIDKSPMRRHNQSALSRFGATNTLLSGDFLLVRAFSLCASLDSTVVKETENACILLTEGEILETAFPFKQQDLQSSLEIARKKTAALFRLAAFCGAYLSQSNPQVTEHFASYGENLGIAFQILDDILDVVSDKDLMGKPAGIDIREHKPTVVNILWRDSGSQLATELLSDTSRKVSHSEIEMALSEIRQSEVIAEARKLAIQYTDTALSELETALNLLSDPDSLSAAALKALNAYVVTRLA